ncbi:aminoacyl tRNA synthase complex-interacting multifunctional protein 1-like [Labrus mixtus]|uniref:aminoacyl tRNA synthase complex-interacting multifunctional protein 1-like n=1 Tax=Labrus mixtus TaxID=508554 RepID=UPI0029C04883|nr:aminoacyl tRNA synthase complex-interacting multifunctional protein 1-like [Labrus mixtus]
MENSDHTFNPSLAAALMKFDPEDGEQIVEYFNTHVLLSREKALLQASVRDQKKLLVENGKLKNDIQQLRVQLQDKQRRRTAKALLAPAPPPVGASAAVPTNPPPSSSHDRRDRQNRRRRGERKARPNSGALSLEAEPCIDPSRLDLRVGRIVSIRRHRLAETMSVQEVDVGESTPRTVISKLEETTDFEELQGRLAVLLCNVKACQLRGVVSQARLLCCYSSNDCSELLIPPAGSNPGDRVTFLNYPGEPDKELQAKQKVWELLQPDLQVDSRGVATFKGCGFEVKGKGLCRAPSLTNSIIR